MKLRTLTITALILASAIRAGAWDGEERDLRTVQLTTPQLMVSNPANMGFWSGRVATVEAFAEKGNGGMISLEESPDCFTWGARTESYCRVSKLITFHGRLSWSHFNGKDMGGQVMMHPELHPVNFLESTTETTGIKKRELYDLCGGLSLNLGSAWSLGFNINYGAGDQTKIKDPRFSNILTELDMSAGVAWRPSRNFTVGVSVLYRDLLEQVRGGIYGATDKQYFIQIDRGGFIGTVEELSGDYNFVSASNYRPMDNRYKGASLQVILFENFVNEFSYRKREGYYGKKASNSPVFFEFNGIEASYDGVVLLPMRNSLHRLAVELDYSTLGNQENRPEWATAENGSTTVIYKEPNSKLLKRTDKSAALDYRWMLGTSGIRPDMTIGLRGTYFSREQTTTIYPVYRKHSYSRIRGELFFEKVFHSGKMSFIPYLSGFFQTGKGTAKGDGSFVPNATSKLKSFDTYLERQFEYETDPRAGGNVSFTATRAFSDKLEVYVKLSDSFTSLIYTPLYLSGRFRNIATVSIGCNF